MQIHWFRKGLRLHDNPALFVKTELLLPIFILNPHYVNSAIASNRWLFFLECLYDLNSNLKSLHSKLHVFRGGHVEVFTDLIAAFSGQISCISIEEDHDPFAMKSQMDLREICAKNKIELRVFQGHTIYEPLKVIELNHGKAPLTMTSFLKAHS